MASNTHLYTPVQFLEVCYNVYSFLRLVILAFTLMYQIISRTAAMETPPPQRVARPRVFPRASSWRAAG